MKKFITHIGLLVLTIFATVFLGLSAVDAQSTNAYADAGKANPTVTSDKDDYAPGEIAHITGSGWTLDDSVHVEFRETPDYPDFHIYNINVNADGAWKIDYQVESRHIGVKFTVIADGKQTGFRATTVFYDANVNFSATGLPSSSTITATYTVKNSNGTTANSGTKTFVSSGTSSTPNIAVNSGQTLTATFNDIIIDGVVYSAPPVSFTSNNNGNGVTTLNATYTAACSRPTATLRSSDQDNAICAGDAVTFTGTGGTNYQFFVGSTSVQNGPSNTYTTTTLTNGQTVTVKVTNAGGCFATSNGITTTVNPLPTPALSSSDADNKICVGQSVTFTGTGGTNYQFFVDGASQGAASGTNTFTTTSLTNGQTVTVKVTNANGCSATSSGITTTVNAPPTCSITGADVVCPSSSNTYTAPAGMSSYSFTLTTANGATITSGANAQTVTVKAGTNCNTTYTLSSTITNSNGCSSTCTKTVTVVDNTAPAITGTIAASTVEGCGADDAPAAATTVAQLEDLGLTISDACTSDANLTVSHTDAATGTCPVVVTRTYTVTDVCGNHSSQTQTITVNDVTAPEITSIPANVTVSCAGDVPAADNGAVEATDNCGGTVTITHEDVRTNGSCANRFTIARTYTATDVCGNHSSQTQTITVNDKTAPTASNPAAVNVQCKDDVPNPDVTVVTDEADNCTGTPTVTFVSDADNGGIGSTISPYIVTRTYKVTDACGNSTNVTQTITAIDNTKPVITKCAPAQRANADANCSAKVPDFTGNVTATDNCTAVGSLVITQAPTAGISVSTGTTNVTITVKDAAGNPTTCTTSFTVNDVTAPTITKCAPAQSANADANCSAKVPDFTGNVTATDNCTASNALVITQFPVAGTSVTKGVTTVTLTIKDAAGNPTTCTTTFTVTDNTAPAITCPSNITLSACQSTATYAPPTATDNCPGVTVARTAGPASGSTFANGTTTTITYTATDASGNKKDCSFTVTRAATLMAKCGNTNPQLYFGYTGDQTSTISGTATGGTGPYTISITMSRPLKCNYINDAGDEKYTATGGTTTNGTCPASGSSTAAAPVSTITNVAVGVPYSVNVTLLANAVFTITVKDAKGCTSTCTTTVNAEDVRCFAGNSSNQKYSICHRTGSATNPCVTICVDKSAVNTHLAHGDVLGSCPKSGCPAPATTTASKSIKGTTDVTEENAGNKLTVKVMPNPSITHFNLLLKSPKNDKVNIRIVDIAGRVIEEKANIAPNGTIQLGAKYFPGMYIAELIQGKERVSVKLIKTYR